jgi:uncharacterized protein YaiI (UPF0178 family)
VANRAWPHSSVHPLIKPILSTLTPESSDNYIITQSKAGDIVLTLDLILTQKLVHKEVCVINHKGATFTKHTIAARLIERNLMYTIAQADKSLRGSKKREESLDIEPFLGTLLAHLRKAKLQKGS